MTLKTIEPYVLSGRAGGKRAALRSSHARIASAHQRIAARQFAMLQERRWWNGDPFSLPGDYELALHYHAVTTAIARRHLFVVIDDHD